MIRVKALKSPQQEGSVAYEEFTKQMIALEELHESFERISTEGAELTEFDKTILALSAKKGNVSVEDYRYSAEASDVLAGVVIAVLVSVAAYVLGYLFGKIVLGKGRLSKSVDSYTYVSKGWHIQSTMFDESKMNEGEKKALEDLRTAMRSGPVGFANNHDNYHNVLAQLTDQAEIILDNLVAGKEKFKTVMKDIVQSDKPIDDKAIKSLYLSDAVNKSISSSIRQLSSSSLRQPDASGSHSKELAHRLKQLKYSIDASFALALPTTTMVKKLAESKAEADKLSGVLAAAEKQKSEVETIMKVFEQVQNQLKNESIPPEATKVANELINELINQIKCYRIIMDMSCDYLDAVTKIIKAADKLKHLEGKKF